MALSTTKVVMVMGVAAAAASPTLTVNTTLIKHGDWVRASYSGLQPSSAYWLGVFYGNASVAARQPMDYPAEGPWTTNAPLKWTANFTGVTDGFYDFSFINAFEDAQIWLFEGSTDVPNAVATHATPIEFADIDAPMRGHLARTASPSEMRVVWNSKTYDAGNQVQWGTEPGAYTGTAIAEPHTYGVNDLCGEPATTHGWFTPHMWNWALATGLAPATVYYYRYGSATTNSWSDEFSFMSAPPVDPNTPVNIVAIADMGMTPLDNSLNHWWVPDATMTTDHIADLVLGSGYNYSMVMHSGDLAYATGYQLKWVSGTIPQSLFRQYRP